MKYELPEIERAGLEKVAPRIWRPRQQSAQALHEKLKEEKPNE